MSELIRDAPIGQIIRYITGNKVLLYPEERSDFQCPMCYAQPDADPEMQNKAKRYPSSTSEKGSSEDPADAEKAGMEAVEPEESPAEVNREGLRRLDTAQLERAETAHDFERRESIRSSLSRTATKSALEKAQTRADLEAAFTAASMPRQPTQQIIPQRTSDGTILVDWYDTDDQADPHNWSQGKKGFASFLICIYTLAFYMGCVYAMSEPSSTLKSDS